MADEQTVGTEPTTTPEPAGATKHGEQDLGFFDDLPVSEEPKVEAQVPQEDPPVYHERLKPLSELRVTDPETKKALHEHLRGWDKELRRQDEERTAFEADHANVLGLVKEIANATTPEAAQKALMEAKAILEQAHGYTLDFGTKPEPVELTVPKKYDNPTDQAYFEDTVKEAVALSTQQSQSELQKLRDEMSQLKSSMGVVDQIAQERRQQAEQRQLADRIKAETPEAVQKISSQASGFKPSEEQCMQAGMKYPHLDLESAIFLTFKKEVMGHVSEQANRGGPRQETVPAGTGVHAQRTEDMNKFEVENELRAIAAQS